LSNGIQFFSVNLLSKNAKNRNDSIYPLMLPYNTVTPPASYTHWDRWWC